MIKGYREFVLRGNVIDLAVAVVIGTAFTALVAAVVAGLITPLVSVVSGDSSTGLTFTIIEGNPATTLDLALVLNAVISFLLTTLVVYVLIVVPVQRLQAVRRRDELAAVTPTPEDIVLLREIRDLLADRESTTRPPGSA